MLREDYDRFLKIAEKEIDKENFFLQITETEEGCYDYEIARIRLNDTHFVQHHRKNISLHDGFFSEIIPYDDLPDSNLRSFFYEKYFKYMKKILGIRKGYRYQIENPLKEKLFYFITLEKNPTKLFRDLSLKAHYP